METSIILDRLTKSFPTAKISSKKNEVNLKIQMNSTTDFYVRLWAKTGQVDPVWKFVAAVECKPIETLVHSVRLNSHIKEFYLTKTLEFDLQYLSITKNEEYIIDDWNRLFMELEYFVQSKADLLHDVNSSLPYIFEALKSDEIHLENVAVAGHYQHRMIAAIVIAMVIKRHEVLSLIAKWRKVVIYDFDIQFLDRLEYMFQHYSPEDLLAKPMEIFYKMSARYGNPFLKNNNKKPNLLKEVVISSEAKSLQVIFNSMPPDGLHEDEYWDKLHKLMARELEVEVSRDDREVFLLHNKSAVTKAKLKAWLRSFWHNHPDAPTE